jgi:hypothetical protein
MLGGILGLLIGIAVAYLSIQPGSAAGVESIGYLVWPMLGMIIGAPAGLFAVLVLRKRPDGL